MKLVLNQTFCKVINNEFAKTLKELSSNSFKLYMYFMDKYGLEEFMLSIREIEEATNLKSKTIHASLMELGTKGYIEINNIKEYIDKSG